MFTAGNSSSTLSLSLPLSSLQFQRPSERNAWYAQLLQRTVLHGRAESRTVLISRCKQAGFQT